jgi:hypothetical protein
VGKFSEVTLHPTETGEEFNTKVSSIVTSIESTVKCVFLSCFEVIIYIRLQKKSYSAWKAAFLTNLTAV